MNTKMIRNVIARYTQAATKTDAYDALRGFLIQNKSNKRLLIELGGYLQTIKDGGKLSEGDLKTIRKNLHRNNASDLADMFRSAPTGRTPRVPSSAPQVSVPVPKPRKPRKPRKPKYPTIKEIHDLLDGAMSSEGKLTAQSVWRSDGIYTLYFEPYHRQSSEYLSEELYTDEYGEYNEDDYDAILERHYDNYEEPLMSSAQKILLKAYPKLKFGYKEDIDFGVMEKGQLYLTVYNKDIKSGGIDYRGS